jgi:hypothetical protein
MRESFLSLFLVRGMVFFITLIFLSRFFFLPMCLKSSSFYVIYVVMLFHLFFFPYILF